jgi:hypothetical protein
VWLRYLAGAGHLVVVETGHLVEARHLAVAGHLVEVATGHLIWARHLVYMPVEMHPKGRLPNLRFRASRPTEISDFRFQVVHLKSEV